MGRNHEKPIKRTPVIMANGKSHNGKQEELRKIRRFAGSAISTKYNTKLRNRKKDSQELINNNVQDLEEEPILTCNDYQEPKKGNHPNQRE